MIWSCGDNDEKDDLMTTLVFRLTFMKMEDKILSDKSSSERTPGES